MLRTCSEPDLSKLFRTCLAENPFFDTPGADNDADLSLDLEALRAQLEEIEQEEEKEESEEGYYWKLLEQ